MTLYRWAGGGVLDSMYSRSRTTRASLRKMPRGGVLNIVSMAVVVTAREEGAEAPAMLTPDLSYYDY